MSDWQLWGTFSVGDHLRPNAFVADLLLYDRLIVPVPPGDRERSRWANEGWRPELQDELLSAIRGEYPNVLTCVPWTDEVTQPMQPHIHQPHSRRQTHPAQSGAHPRDQDLAARTSRHQPRRPIQRRPEIVTVTFLGLTGVHPHPNPNLHRPRPHRSRRVPPGLPAPQRPHPQPGRTQRRTRPPPW